MSICTSNADNLKKRCFPVPKTLLSHLKSTAFYHEALGFRKVPL